MSPLSGNFKLIFLKTANFYVFQVYFSVCCQKTTSEKLVEFVNYSLIKYPT